MSLYLKQVLGRANDGKEVLPQGNLGFSGARDNHIQVMGKLLQEVDDPREDGAFFKSDARLGLILENVVQQDLEGMAEVSQILVMFRKFVRLPLSIDIMCQQMAKDCLQEQVSLRKDAFR